MHQKDKNIDRSGESEAADLDTLFSEVCREDSISLPTRPDSELCAIAEMILPELQKMIKLIEDGNYEPLKPRALIFFRSVKQMAEGKATLLTYPIAGEINIFQSEVNSTLSRWYNMSCYPDVTAHRERLVKIINTYFPILNRIYELIDYQSIV